MASFDPGYGYRACPWSAGMRNTAPTPLLLPHGETSFQSRRPDASGCGTSPCVGLDHDIVTCLQEHDGWYGRVPPMRPAALDRGALYMYMALFFRALIDFPPNTLLSG